MIALMIDLGTWTTGIDLTLVCLMLFRATCKKLVDERARE
jgi:hypothetical protein